MLTALLVARCAPEAQICLGLKASCTLGQVILKPDPGRPQELYLGSLEALGIDTRAHDLRFVEDNWENPTLGAWGLGWEVWMDGEAPRRQQSCICRVSISSQPGLAIA